MSKSKSNRNRVQPRPRPAQPHQPAPEEAEGLGPVRIDATAEIADEHETLFIISRQELDEKTGEPVFDEETGEPVLVDDEYTMPKKVRPAFALKYLNDLRKRGDAVAVAESMALLLGEEAMDAMSECEHITDEHMEQIMKIIEKKMASASGRILGNG